jgi:hypothetical protein
VETYSLDTQVKNEFGKELLESFLREFGADKEKIMEEKQKELFAMKTRRKQK